MVAAIDTGLDFYRQVLALRARRQEILSADIANASTPGFKAIDLDFAGALAGAAGGKTSPHAPGPHPSAAPHRMWLVDDARHMATTTSPGGGADPDVARYIKYQAGSEVTLDGNSVDLNHEKVAAAENAVQYEAATTFTSLTIRMLATAIAGSGSPSPNAG